MSKFNLYSVFDRASQTYNTPLSFVSDAVAIRSLREALSDMSSIMAKYPDDYSLVKVGEFYVENGELVKCHVVLFDTFAGLLSRGGELSGGLPPEAAERPHAVCDHKAAGVPLTSNPEESRTTPKQEKNEVSE